VTHTRQSNNRRAVRRVVALAATTLAATAGVAIAVPASAFAADKAGTASTVRVAASDDTYTSTARPTYTFGGSDSLVAGTKSGDRMMSFLKFNVTALPAGTSIAKAELKLTRDTSTPLPSTVTLKKVGTTSWTQAAVTGKNAPAAGADIATAKPAATAAAVSFDLTASVTKAGTYTFAVTSAATTAVARFQSSEKGANGPQLTLTLKADAPKPTTPVTTPPTAKPTTPVTPTTPGTNCTVDAKLVPSCNVLWGAAAGGFSETPRDQALREWEAKSGRTASIYHTYHRGDEMFPTKAEIAMANEPGKPRVLFTNWKVGYGTKWGKVANGEMDARIDKLSAYIKANYGKDKFFMAVHHEPENDVSTVAGSQMTAKDYANMVRHTIQRMKADGVTNVVFVMAYMNVEKWNDSKWWSDLYPGNDVIDWVGVDSYVNAQPKGFHNGDFTNLMNRTTGKSTFNGWYNWALTTGKPVMVAEWAVYECKTTCSPDEKAKIHAKVVEQMKAMPAIKAIVAFDTASDQQGLDMRIDSTPQALASFKKIAADDVFTVNIGR
jgi:hypothetical protein